EPKIELTKKPPRGSNLRGRDQQEEPLMAATRLEKIGTRLYEYKGASRTSYYADLEQDGKQVRRKLAATTRTAAREEQKHLQSDNARGLVVAPSRITVSEVAQEWLDQLDVKPRSREAYELHLKRNILPQFGSRAIQNIRPKDI